MDVAFVTRMKICVLNVRLAMIWMEGLDVSVEVGITKASLHLVQLAYMCEKSAGSGIWYWPTVEDLSHEPVSNLLKKVQLVMDEKISNQRMHYYKVTK